MPTIVLPKSIELVEVGPRDGLQNQRIAVGCAEKVSLIERLIASGLRRIEAVSFVSPRRVPQMADAEAIMAAVPVRKDVTYVGLVLNERGARRAFETSIDQLGTVAVASDAFGQRNQGQSVEESIVESVSIMRSAHANNRTAQVSISMAFGCPYEGRVDQERVISIAKRLTEGNPIEIAVADTIGVAVPSQVGEMVERLGAAIHPIPVRVHFHNTRNTAVANVWAAVLAGATSVDTSVGGLGGCPFAPNATGNVATEDVAYLLRQSGISVGVNLSELIRTSRWMSETLGMELPSMVSRAGDFPLMEAR